MELFRLKISICKFYVMLLVHTTYDQRSYSPISFASGLFSTCLGGPLRLLPSFSFLRLPLLRLLSSTARTRAVYDPYQRSVLRLLLRRHIRKLPLPVPGKPPCHTPRLTPRFIRAFQARRPRTLVLRNRFAPPPASPTSPPTAQFHSALEDGQLEPPKRG